MKTQIKNTPMASAPFVYDKEGNIAWDKMWDSFCYLAKEGGPPHRESPLKHIPAQDIKFDSVEYQKAINEVSRAYALLTPYSSRDCKNGWIEVKLHSMHMATWFAEIINLENVECRQKEKYIYLPISHTYTLEKEVKNLVTVLAKAHHYWSQHRNWLEKIIIHISGKDIHQAL
jgi:sirohydrochlorin cobaltochelatase